MNRESAEKAAREIYSELRNISEPEKNGMITRAADIIERACIGKRSDAGEQMRTRVLERIQGWLTNSNAKDNEQCVLLLNALAGDVQIITLPTGRTKAEEEKDAIRK